MQATQLAPRLSRSGMKEWLDVLSCPADRGRWTWTPSAEDGEGAPDGVLRCSHCARTVPVEHGIVRYLEPSQLRNEAQVTEISARDEAAESYEETVSPQRSAAEIEACLRALDPRPSDVVLEIGCGTGRLLRRYARRVGRVVATDFSLASLRVLAKRLSPREKSRCLLVHGDMLSLPLRARAFPKIASFQVLEHLPSPALRAEAVQRVAEWLAAEGSFTCSVYHWSRRKRRMARRGEGDNACKEGRHATNIYYYNFDADEFRRLVEGAGLHVTRFEGLDVRFRGMRLLGAAAPRVALALRRTAFGIARAELLLVGARTVVAPRGAGLHR